MGYFVDGFGRCFLPGGQQRRVRATVASMILCNTKLPRARVLRGVRNIELGTTRFEIESIMIDSFLCILIRYADVVKRFDCAVGLRMSELTHQDILITIVSTVVL